MCFWGLVLPGPGRCSLTVQLGCPEPTPITPTTPTTTGAKEDHQPTDMPEPLLPGTSQGGPGPRPTFNRVSVASLPSGSHPSSPWKHDMASAMPSHTAHSREASGSRAAGGKGLYLAPQGQPSWWAWLVGALEAWSTRSSSFRATATEPKWWLSPPAAPPTLLCLPPGEGVAQRTSPPVSCRVDAEPGRIPGAHVRKEGPRSVETAGKESWPTPGPPATGRVPCHLPGGSPVTVGISFPFPEGQRRDGPEHRRHPPGGTECGRLPSCLSPGSMCTTKSR